MIYKDKKLICEFIGIAIENNSLNEFVASLVDWLKEESGLSVKAILTDEEICKILNIKDQKRY